MFGLNESTHYYVCQRYLRMNMGINGMYQIERTEMEHTLDQFGKEKITPHPTRTAAIVQAAGQGKRMKSKIQQQFLLLEEKPVIWYALHAFEESRVDDVILVTGADEIAYCRDEIVGKYGFS